MNKTLEKILEDELFSNETFEGEANLQIKNTSEGTKMPTFLIGNSIQDGEPSPENPIEIKNCRDIEILNTHKNLLKPTWAQDLLDRLGIQKTDQKNCITEIDGHRYLKYYAGLGYQSGLEYFAKGYFKENTQYTFKCILMRDNNALTTNIVFRYTDGTRTLVDLSQNANMKRTEYKFTSDANKTVRELSIANMSNCTFIDLDSCILYEGTDDLPYEGYGQAYKFPSKEGQVFHKNDYLADDGTHHVRNTVQFKDKNLIGMGQINETDYRYSFNFVQRDMEKRVSDLEKDLYCNIATPSVSSQNTEEDKDKITIRRANYYDCFWMYFPKSYFKATTSDELKLELYNKLDELEKQGTPLKIEYTLAEEKIEPYSPEQQEAYTKLMQAVAYDDETNIFCTDEIPCNFKVNAKISKIKKIMEGEKI